MIADKDRSGYFGASDVTMIMGSWKTESFRKWWLQKIGANNDHFDNKFTLAGTNYEHRILESLGIPSLKLDEQIIHENLKLRVNYDGTTEDCTYECKTFRLATAGSVQAWRVPKRYWQQVQVQMFAKGIHKGQIVAYGLEEADYDNFLRPIDPSRLRREDIAYDPVWIAADFLPRLRILAGCLKQGIMPEEAMKGGR